MRSNRRGGRTARLGVRRWQKSTRLASMSHVAPGILPTSVLRRMRPLAATANHNTQPRKSRMLWQSQARCASRGQYYCSLRRNQHRNSLVAAAVHGATRTGHVNSKRGHLHPARQATVQVRYYLHGWTCRCCVVGLAGRTQSRSHPAPSLLHPSSANLPRLRGKVRRGTQLA